MPSEHTGTVQSGTPRYNLDTVAEYLPMEAVPDDADFAELLQALRVRAGLTVREVAERMGVSVGNVSQYLYRRRGRGGNGTLRWFLRFLEACDSSMILAIPPRRGAYAQQRNPTIDRAGSAGVRLDGARRSATRRHRPVLLDDPDGTGDADRLRRAVAAATRSPGGDSGTGGG